MLHTKSSLEKTVGIVGTGLSARVFHAPFIQNCKYLTLNAFLARSKRVVSGYERIPVYTWEEIEQFLKDLDVVIITTPSDSHYDIAKQFIKYKKNVVVEKPFTLNSDQALDLISEAQKENVILTVYHNRRWDGDFKTVREVVTKKGIGRIVEVESRINRYKVQINDGEWRESETNLGSGILYDLGSHLIDQALMLWDSGTFKSVFVSGFIRNQRQHKNIDDYVQIILEFINQNGSMGPIVTLKTSLVAKISGPRWIVHGDQGSVCIYGFDPQEEQLMMGIMPWEKGFGVKEQRQMIVVKDTDFSVPVQKGDWTGFYETLHKHLMNQPTDDVVSLKQAFDVVRITEAFQKSAELGIKLEVDL